MLDDYSTEPSQLDELHVAIPVALLRKLSQIAVAKGMTMTEVVKEALAPYIAQYLDNTKGNLTN